MKTTKNVKSARKMSDEDLDRLIQEKYDQRLSEIHQRLQKRLEEELQTLDRNAIIAKRYARETGDAIAADYEELSSRAVVASIARLFLK